MEEAYECPKDTPCEFGGIGVCSKIVARGSGEYRASFKGDMGFFADCHYSKALNAIRDMEKSGVEICVQGASDE